MPDLLFEVGRLAAARRPRYDGDERSLCQQRRIEHGTRQAFGEIGRDEYDVGAVPGLRKTLLHAVLPGDERLCSGQPPSEGADLVGYDRPLHGLRDAVENEYGNDQAVDRDTLRQAHEHQRAPEELGFLGNRADGRAADPGDGVARAERRERR